MVTSFVLSSLRHLPELIIAVVGLVIAASGRFRTSHAGVATRGWILALANVVCSLLGLLIFYTVTYRTDGYYGVLPLNVVTDLVAAVLTLGTWVCFLVALLRKPTVAPPAPGDRS